MKLIRGDQRKGLLSKESFVGVRKCCGNCGCIMEIERASDIQHEPIHRDTAMFYITCIACRERITITAKDLKKRR